MLKNYFSSAKLKSPMFLTSLALMVVGFISLVALSYYNIDSEHKFTIKEIDDSLQTLADLKMHSFRTISIMKKHENIFQVIKELDRYEELLRATGDSQYREKAVTIKEILENVYFGYGLSSGDINSLLEKKQNTGLWQRVGEGQKRFAENLQFQADRFKKSEEKEKEIFLLRKDSQSFYGFLTKFYLKGRDIRDDMERLNIKRYDRSLD